MTKFDYICKMREGGCGACRAKVAHSISDACGSSGARTAFTSAPASNQFFLHQNIFQIWFQFKQNMHTLKHNINCVNISFFLSSSKSKLALENSPYCTVLELSKVLLTCLVRCFTAHKNGYFQSTALYPTWLEYIHQ